MSEPSVCVIVLAHNDCRLIRRFLLAMQEHTTYPKVDIHVVDNDSDDGTATMVKEDFPRTTLHEPGENLGVPRGYNRVIRSVDADYYVCMDSDAEVTERWLAPLVTFMEAHPDTGIVGPVLSSPERDRFHTGFRCRRIGPEGLRTETRPKEPAEVDCLLGACMMLRAGMLNEIGLWEELLSPIMSEEEDICWRARRDGWKVICHHDSLVLHYKEEAPGGQNYFLNKRNAMTVVLLDYPLTYLAPRLLFEPARFGLSLFDVRRFTFKEDAAHIAKEFLRGYGAVAMQMDDIVSGRIARIRGKPICP